MWAIGALSVDPACQHRPRGARRDHRPARGRLHRRRVRLVAGPQPAARSSRPRSGGMNSAWTPPGAPPLPSGPGSGPWDDCRMPVVVGIETSCDETGVGVVRDGDADRLGVGLAAASRRTRGSAAWCRKRLARAHLEAAGCRLFGTRHSPRPKDHWRRIVDAVAVTAGLGAGHSTHRWGWPPRRPTRSRGTSRSTACTILARARRRGHCSPTDRSPNPCIVLIVSGGGHTSSLLVVRRDLVADEITASWATRSTTRRGGLRQGRAGARSAGFPGGPWIDRAAQARATRPRSRSRAG